MELYPIGELSKVSSNFLFQLQMKALQMLRLVLSLLWLAEMDLWLMDDSLGHFIELSFNLEESILFGEYFTIHWVS